MLHLPRILALGLLLAAAIGLRVWHLEQKNMWLDEAASWDTSRRALPDLMALAKTDIHPPLYYVILRGWMAVAGDSPAALRGLSVIFSVIALLLAARLADRWLPRGPALLVVGWLAVSPHMVAYAQEARMYAALTATVLAGCLAYWRWLESGGTRTRALVAYAAFASVSVYLHYFAFLFVGALWLHLALVSWFTAPQRRLVGRGGWLRWIAAHLILLIAYLPWLPTAVAQITRGQDWRQPLTLADLPRYAGGFVRDIVMGSQPNAPPLLVAAVIALCAVLAVGWLRLAFVRSSAPRPNPDTFLLVTGLVPLVVSLAVLPITGQMQLSRYLVFVTPFALIGAARGWTGTSERPVAAMAALTVAIAASIVCLTGYFRSTVKDSDLRPIVRYIERELSRPNGSGSARGVLLVEPSTMRIPLRYETREMPSVEYPFVLETDPLQHALDATIPSAGSDPMWLVLDRRWDRFAGFDPRTDARLVEIDVPGLRRHHARLFRVRAPPPAVRGPGL
jgi:mannosyltransferase